MGVRSRLVQSLLALFLVVAAPLGVSAQAATTAAAPAPPVQPATTAPPATKVDRTYVLGPSDVIEVAVLGRTDFTTRGRVGEDGTVQLPYLGAVAVSGRTVVALEDQLAKDLEKGGYFAKPIVKIDIVSFASRYVTVLGNVGSPGLVPVDRAYRLSEMLARVGGVKESGSDYIILRSGDTLERRILVTTLATGDISQDPYVSPGDKIYAPNADLFYISGQVLAPSTYKLTDGMTVRLAIARGGGLNAQGSDKKIQLIRKGAKIKAGLETKLEAGDVIIIGERLF